MRSFLLSDRKPTPRCAWHNKQYHRKINTEQNLFKSKKAGTSMKLVINIKDLRIDQIKKEISLFKTAGFNAMDYGGLMEAFKADCPFRGEDYREFVEEISAVCKQMDFPVVQTHAPFKFTAQELDDPVLFETVTLPTMIRCLEITALLGATIMVVHPIHHMVYRGHEEEVFERNMAYYRCLIPYCETYGVRIAIENMFQKDALRKCIVHDTCSRPEELIRYVDTLDSPYIVACLDVGHVGLPLQEIEADDFVRLLGRERLQSLHIHDNNYEKDQHVLPYMGKINWERVCRALGEIDYQGDFTYEIKHDLILDKDGGFVPIGARFMADVGKHLISMVEANRLK